MTGAPSPSAVRSPAASLALYAFFAILGALLLVLAARKPIDHDEHQFIASAALLAREGLLPYRDFPYHHLPYLTIVYAALFQVTDHLLLAARWLCVACSIGALALVFSAVRNVFHGFSSTARDALAAAFVLVVAVNPLFLYATGRAWNHDASVLLALAAFWLMSRAGGATAPLRWIFWSGVAIGAAVGVRSTFAFLLPPFALACVLPRGNAPAVRPASAWVALAAGVALALLPLLPLFAIAPAEFLHGNLRYNLRLNPGYREALGYGVGMSLQQKLAYFVSEVLVLRRNAALLALYAGCWACLAGRTGRAYAFEQRFIAVLLPFVMLAALSATPSWYQYFYPLVPFTVLGIAYACADLKAMRLRTAARVAIAALVIGNVLALRHFMDDSDKPWTAFEAHDVGRRIAEVGDGGPVLTLAPILPLEGGVTIYPELATGPFAWRTAALMAADERERLKLVGPVDLGRLVGRARPTAILVGAEHDPVEKLEEPFVQYAREHGYAEQLLDMGFTLWVAPTAIGTRSSSKPEKAT